MKKPKPAAKAPEPKADFITQNEIRAVAELYDIAHDLAVEVRRRIENGARVQKGRYLAKAGTGSNSIAYERRHREQCAGVSLSGLTITDKETDNA